MEKQITLGHKVKDAMTGYVGRATLRVESLTATPRICVASLVEGKVHEEWFDEPRLAEVSGD